MILGSSSAKGTLFGLPCTDLTDDQLNKVTTPKLVECLPIDSRIENILATRMRSDLDVEEVEHYNNLTKEDWDKHASLRQAYNDLFAATDSFKERLNGSWYFRGRFVFWVALNDNFRLAEVQHFLNQETSVVSSDNVDYDWLNANYPDLSKQITHHILATEGSYNRSGTIHVLSCASQDMLLELEPKIQKLDKGCQLQMLLNPNTPEAWLDGLLRIYAKRVKYSAPNVRRPLSVAVLCKLPPITRLEVMERLVYKLSGEELVQVLPDLKTGEDFRALLFGALTRHADRVIKLVRNYTTKTGKE